MSVEIDKVSLDSAAEAAWNMGHARGQTDTRWIACDPAEREACIAATHAAILRFLRAKGLADH